MRRQGISGAKDSILLTDMATRRVVFASSAVTAVSSHYQEHVNPQWVSLLNLLGMNVEYERCFGCELFIKDGRRILDFLSGYCVHNAGHNHPYIIQALKDEMDKCGPAMPKAAPPLTVTAEQLDEFVNAIRDVVERAQTSPAFWTEALGMARGAVNI